MKLFHALIALSLATSVAAQPISSELSESFGHVVYKSIASLGVEFDIEALSKGIHAASEGKAPPFSPEVCMEALSAAKDETDKVVAAENLKAADAFIAKQAKQRGMSALEDGKVLYTITKKGKGAAVTLESTPLIRYKGTLLDGTVFDEQSDGGIPIPLTNTILGFQKGLTGMKEGEKRTLHIHPDLGYGSRGMLPPNSLLTFEIEVLEADTSK